MMAAGGHAKDDLSALEIMQAVQDRDEGDQVTQTMEMILIDRRGNQRRRVMSSIRKDFGEDTYSILFFTEPADVRDTAFLTWDYDSYERDDDQWLYLPALRKTKRIASRDKSGSFMGSDFSYADMTARSLNRYQFNIMKEPVVNEHAVWQIEAVPNEEEADRTGYKRSIVFVRQDNFIVVRAVNWQAKGGITKYMEVKELQQIDGIWVSTQVQMTSRKGKEVRHRTILFNRDTLFNQPLQDDWFAMQQLEKGPPR
jgi:hypothetical protein|tara:strand:+ start:4877 stop:5641 length:765 start_codon:yes stop_codon:yes gene_type:complete